MIKVGFCVAYDWDLLQYAIPQIYLQADVICLSVDRNRQSWSGEPFSWDETGFRKLTSSLDPELKIKVYEDTFYDPALLPMQNEVVQRNKMAQFLGEGGWHVQLDADEYFVNFEGFVSYLKAFKSDRKVNICCPMINLYKQVPEGMLWIKPLSFEQIEFFAIATKYPQYAYGRRNGNFDVKTDYPILHQSWAREEQEIWEKLNNWGHAKDIDVNAYFLQWQKANGLNYQTYKDFHHLHPSTWPALELLSFSGNIANLLSLKSAVFNLPITKSKLAKVNSLWLSRARKVWAKVVGKSA